ncbi:MAG: hypothetical protein ACRYGR_01805 [Janthinobacterium lividum]
MTLPQKLPKKAIISKNLQKTDLTKVKKTSCLSPQDKLLQDLEAMYQAAFDAKNFAVALRILELRGKQLGLFMDKKSEPVKSLQQMSEQELQALLGN